MSKENPFSGAESAFWRRIHLLGPLSPAAAATLLKLRFSSRDRQRMRNLLAKAKTASLDEDERHEIETYERLGCLLDILHSKARRSLKKHKTAS